ncbi:MAG TPA: hypothetical protein PLV08_09575 [Flavobacteriales bacterium]|nr:hypothetical protein [Flavobacteriales bacterium]HQW98502.1 hypothetical protein [Flavobacteriales bacterium]HQY00014.1 hypothetical protein [Flavobacteriales bacterium]
MEILPLLLTIASVHVDPQGRTRTTVEPLLIGYAAMKPGKFEHY